MLKRTWAFQINCIDRERDAHKKNANPKENNCLLKKKKHCFIDFKIHLQSYIFINLFV